MTVTLRRTGLPPAVWRIPDLSWRTWAFDASIDEPNVPGPLTITFQPLARNRASIFKAPNYFGTVELVIDGLIAAKVLTDRSDIANLVLRPSTVAGVDGLEVTVTPIERTDDDPQRHLASAA